MYNISCHVLHDLWPQKGVILSYFKLIVRRINWSYRDELFDAITYFDELLIFFRS